MSFIKKLTPWTQDINWTYVRRSADDQWTSSVRQIHICVQGIPYFLKTFYSITQERVYKYLKEG